MQHSSGEGAASAHCAPPARDESSSGFQLRPLLGELLGDWVTV